MTNVALNLKTKLDFAKQQLAELDTMRADYALAAHAGADLDYVRQGASFQWAALHGSNPNQAAALATINEKRTSVLAAIDELTIALGQAELTS
jgi:hypothetical protein